MLKTPIKIDSTAVITPIDETPKKEDKGDTKTHAIITGIKRLIILENGAWVLISAHKKAIKNKTTKEIFPIKIFANILTTIKIKAETIKNLLWSLNDKGFSASFENELTHLDLKRQTVKSIGKTIKITIADIIVDINNSPWKIAVNKPTTAKNTKKRLASYCSR